MKRKFFLLLFISSILMVSVFMSYSYGFFKKKMEITDFTLKVGNLAYQIDKNQIYIMPLEVQIVEFTITSQNEIESKYELYYQTDSKDISVGYVENTKALPTGTIKSNESKTVQIKISNGSNAHQIVYFGVEGGFIQNTIELTQGKKITEKRAKDTFDLIFNHPGENCKTYNDGTDTFLVGKCRTNYVWYSGKLWRVIKKNNTTGAIKMITENAVTTMSSNAENQPTFIDSYTDQWLQQEFLPTLHDYEDFLVVDSVWDITTNSSDTPTKPTGTTTVKRAVGLLNSYEYYTTYNNSSGLATSSNNYLVSKSYWSLITPYNETKIRSVLENGTLSTATPQDGLTIRPVTI